MGRYLRDNTMQEAPLFIAHGGKMKIQKIASSEDLNASVWGVKCCGLTLNIIRIKNKIKVSII